ncbi:MAG TPA: hypothetical protein VKU19_16180 [Bryobacteraceae bacterium]|nr:hypothetical protein [Bryobacteraceae bacterium]
MGIQRCAAILAMAALEVVGGDLNGRLIITKQLSRKTVATAVYNLRGAALPAATPATEPVNEFDRMVVILDAKSAVPPEPQKLVMEQRNGRFDPDLMVVSTGSTVEFPNADPIFHNVFSLSSTQSFDLGFYPKGQTRTVKLNRSGIVQVYCHIHANMYAAIVVTSSPWYGKPSADGSFSWSRIPPGHYRVLAWHKVAGMHQTTVDIPANGAVDVTMRIPIDVGGRP